MTNITFFAVNTTSQNVWMCLQKEMSFADDNYKSIMISAKNIIKLFFHE